MKSSITKRFWVVSVVVVLGVLSIGLVLTAYRLSAQKRVNFLVTDMIHELQLEATKSHLRLEEIMDGDDLVSVENVWRAIDNAILLAEAMLTGGKSLHDQDVDPVREPRIRSEVEEIRRNLFDYKVAAKNKYDLMMSRTFTRVDDRFFDSIYNQLMDKSLALDNHIEDVQARKEEKTKILFWVILLPWAAVLVISISELWNHELSRWQAKTLKKANDQLEGMVNERTLELTTEVDRRILAEMQSHRMYQIQSVLNTLLQISLEQIPFEQQLDQSLALILSTPWLNFDPKGGIFLVEDERDILVLKVQQGFPPELLSSCLKVPFDKCLCGKAARKKEIIFVNALDHRHEIENDSMANHGHYCVPILSGNEVLGLLNLYVDAEHKHSLEEEEFLSMVARTLAGIIERRKMIKEGQLRQAQLIQADKMASLGLMVSGVTHEINNPNNFILSNAQVLKDIFKDIQPLLDEYCQENKACRFGGLSGAKVEKILPELLASIEEGSRRITNTIENLRDFARHEVGRPDEEFNLNDIVKKSMNIIGNQISKFTDNVSMELAEGLPPLKGAVQKIEQVMINLLMNAAHALPDTSCSIIIRSGLDKDASQVFIQVIDQGVGIAPENINKIMEPFFTTKADRGGTGLGLSVSYSIVEEHNGELVFESEPGRGTTATVRLPVL